VIDADGSGWNGAKDGCGSGFFVRIVRRFWVRGKFEVLIKEGVSGAFEFMGWNAFEFI
jgi:hypothetical protein